MRKRHDGLRKDGCISAAHLGAPAVPPEGHGLHPRAGGHAHPRAGHSDIRSDAEAGAVLHHHRMFDMRWEEGPQAAGDCAQKSTGCGAHC